MKRLREQASNANPQQGSALFLALIVVLAVSTLGACLLRVTSSVAQRQSAEIATLRAFYLAEAGLAEAFQAVRVGRTGQIGSQEAPARFGGGLVWVDSTESSASQVRLESTGMVGTGRATLALVVEPVNVPLGFFADEDLVIDSVLLVDGFDSEEASYIETAVTSPETRAVREARKIINIVGVSGLLTLLDWSDAVTPSLIMSFLGYGESEAVALSNHMSNMRRAHAAGQFDHLIFPSDSPSGAVAEGEAPPSELGVHTAGGGLLASNGNVVLDQPAGSVIEIWGDVQPGPSGSVIGLENALIVGDTQPRSQAVELPEVEIPPLALASAVRHEGLLPLIISPGDSGHDSIEVAADCELILRGPATIVIGQLTLEPGALLTLDTRGGDVELYITEGLDLQTGSQAATSSDRPEEVSLQVAPIPSFGEAPVNLEATSQFHGTIYAPETEVKIGSDFEIFGGVVARKLEIGPGARLHFDSSGFEGSAIPRIVSWRIVEVPAAVRGRRGDPFQMLGVEPADLADLSQAHELSKVQLEVNYLCIDGSVYDYSGTEDQFDWLCVAEVNSVERDPERVKKDVQEPTTEDPKGTLPGGIRQEIKDALYTLNGSEARDFLLSQSPLSEEEKQLAVTSGALADSDYLDVLIANSPMDEKTLNTLFSASANLSSSTLKDLLLANSPLPATTLAKLPSSKLGTSDKEAILAAQ